MGDEVAGQVSALQEFATDVARTSGTIQGPVTKDEALHYAPPPMPVEALQAPADAFKAALLNAAERAQTWDDEFRGSLGFYSDYAAVLSNRVAEVDQAHGQALKDLLDQIAGGIPRRGR